MIDCRENRRIGPSSLHRGMRRFVWSAGLVAVAIVRADSIADTMVPDPESDTRIIGGQEVDPAWSYPFVVGLTEAGGFSCCQCGGSLITSEWVLTAAHCIDSSRSYTVLIYGHSRSQGQNHSCTQEIPVAETVCHEGFNLGEGTSTEDFEADICLLRLAFAPNCAEEMEAGGQFARLDKGDTGRDGAGTAVTLAGWGLTDENNSDTPDLMHHVTTKMVAFSDCNSAYNGGLVEGSMICAGEAEGGKDSCQGDSGGPLFVEENGFFVQVGVVSFGNGCGSAEFPGVYASVAHYLPWIIGKVIGPPSVTSECTDTCTSSFDDECDDGGPGSEFGDCDFGTDCADCGARDAAPSPPPQFTQPPQSWPPPPPADSLSTPPASSQPPRSWPPPPLDSSPSPPPPSTQPPMARPPPPLGSSPSPPPSSTQSPTAMWPPPPLSPSPPSPSSDNDVGALSLTAFIGVLAGAIGGLIIFVGVIISCSCRGKTTAGPTNGAMSRV